METYSSFREELQARIDYLVTAEFEELKAIDALGAGTIERDLKWKLIHELCNRRQELQDTLKMYDKYNTRNNFLNLLRGKRNG